MLAKAKVCLGPNSTEISCRVNLYGIRNLENSYYLAACMSKMCHIRRWARILFGILSSILFYHTVTTNTTPAGLEERELQDSFEQEFYDNIGFDNGDDNDMVKALMQLQENENEDSSL